MHHYASQNLQKADAERAYLELTQQWLYYG